MKYYLFNGSPRSNRNTVKMLESAKKGIIDKFKELRPDEDCDVKLIDLFKLNYKGCMSCFNCKLIDGPFYGKCPINDDLKDLLEDVWDCDGLIIGSPIYFGELTGQTRNLLERLIFPKLVYGGESLSTNRMPTALFLTMNVNEELFNQLYTPMLENTKVMMNIAFKEPVVLQAY
ncbi:MAG: flavodoxin family protein, partial [Methanosphaera sp.]|nr:flavodoxin family protein [Methanosphaera sp.]